MQSAAEPAVPGWVSCSCAIAARSRRPVTGIHSLLGLQIYRANTYLPISDRLVLRECRTIPLRASLHYSAYAVRRRTSRSGFGSAVHVRSLHDHAEPLRVVTVCPVLPAERYSRSDFGLTQLFANKSAPRRTVTGKAEPHNLTAAMKNARKRSFSPKPAVTTTVMQVFDCGAIPVRQPTVHDSQPWTDGATQPALSQTTRHRHTVQKLTQNLRNS